jgi:hypothetical protein
MKDSYNDSSIWVCNWRIKYLSKPFLREAKVKALKAFMAEKVDVISPTRYEAMAWSLVAGSPAFQTLTIGVKADVFDLSNASVAPSIFDKCE